MVVYWNVSEDAFNVSLYSDVDRRNPVSNYSLVCLNVGSVSDIHVCGQRRALCLDPLRKQERKEAMVVQPLAESSFSLHDRTE